MVTALAQNIENNPMQGIRGYYDTPGGSGSTLPKYLLQHAFAHHGDAVEFDRGAHHRQVEMT